MTATPTPGARPETVLGVLLAAAEYLAERGVDAPRLSVELLLARVLGTTRLQLYLLHDRPLSEDERARLRPMVAERGRHVPVEYLLGDCDFRGHVLEVSREVLVPRPETEHLVDLAVERAPRGARCVELGTGSGAIAIALAVERPDLEIWAVEIEPGAARIASRNAERHDVGERVHVEIGSYWDPVRALPAFELLISNPPYVDPARPELLESGVRQHEPHRALFTRAGDPASAYREILAGLPGRVAPGGHVLFETGVGASGPAAQLMRDCAVLERVEVATDLAGIDRYLSARVRGGDTRAG